MANKKQVKEHKLHVKEGDKVIVISGKDKGKTGSVKEVLAKDNKIVVEGLNMVTRAQKGNMGQQGGLIKMEAPIDSSKVMLYCSACEKATRIKKQADGDRKVRICKKCGEQLN